MTGLSVVRGTKVRYYFGADTVILLKVSYAYCLWLYACRLLTVVSTWECWERIFVNRTCLGTVAKALEISIADTRDLKASSAE